MLTNAERKRRKKAQPHPMSAGAGRQPNGRTRRGTTQDERLCGPTDELLRHIEQHGPTGRIQNALWTKKITEDEARGLEAFAGIRRVLGVAEYQAPGILARMMPHGGGSEVETERVKAAKRAYAEINTALAPIRNAMDACQTICDDRDPLDWIALKAGARTLWAMFIAGQKIT